MEMEQFALPEEEDSFPVRAKDAYNGKYEASMRRSLQSVVLYEADRSLMPRYPQLRPFQKKIALVATAGGLLKTLDFLNDYHRQEIMFRTNASREPLPPDLAWKRMKLITREINQAIVPKAKMLIDDQANIGKSHNEICHLLLQKMYDENSGSSGPYPPTFEYTHNNAFTVYRIYYRGCAADPNLFPAIPSFVAVPSKKPANMREAGPGSGEDTPLIPELTADERRGMLKEVKDHTELLREFQGVVPDAELTKRKKQLYAALPPVPPVWPPRLTAIGLGAIGIKKRKKVKVDAAAAVPKSPTPAASTPATSTPAASMSAAKEDEEEDAWEKLAAAKDAVKTYASV